MDAWDKFEDLKMKVKEFSSNVSKIENRMTPAKGRNSRSLCGEDSREEQELGCSSKTQKTRTILGNNGRTRNGRVINQMPTSSMQKGRREENNSPHANIVKRLIILSQFVGSKMLNVENASNSGTYKSFAKPTPQMDKFILLRKWKPRMSNYSQPLGASAAIKQRLVSKTG
ncbi:hypothetical protein OIU84_024465 [Salix udensis]|uniref:Uncharacterized protein n=1 Tax=Salix udensis TaxID=889485 RepID=A0AAD6PCJ7_9ROSI|nr:hypothetical protein OIU84_024465 [Salix udensis]